MTSLLGPRATLGNVQWTAAGVTASFVTPTLNLRYASADTRLTPYHRWAALYAAVGTTFRHHAIDRLVPPSAVMRRMAAAVPGGAGRVTEFPAWQRKMADTADFLARLPRQPAEKWTVLTVDLPSPRPGAARLAGWQARAAAGLPPAMPAPEEQQRARGEADRLYARLRTLVPGIEPATAGDMRWLASYCQTFGGVEPPCTHPAFQAPDPDAGRPVLVAPLGETALNPDRHRATYVSIDAPLVHDIYSDEPPGTQRVYQTFLVACDFAQTWDYPQAALWDDLDDLDIRVTGTLVARTVSNTAERRKLKGLFKHTRWTQDESSGDADPDVDTAVAHEDLVRELAELASSGGPATPAAYVLRLGATSVDELEQAVATVRAVMDPTQTRFARPRGMQTRIWQAVLPGSPHGAELVRYERQVHPKDLAGLGLFHGHELGDPDGRLYGLTLGGEHAHPHLVFRNPTRGPRSEHGNTGATLGSVGQMGSGKSLALKQDADQVLDLGGGIIAIDISEQREWWRASHAWTVPAMTIDPADPAVTFDPLRTFTANLPDDPGARADMLRLAERHTVGFFALRLSLTGQDDDRYDALEGAVQDLLGDDPPLPPSAPNLLQVLRYRAGDPTLPRSEDRRLRAETSPSLLAATETVVKRLTNLGRSGDKGRSIMGTGRPLDLRVPAIVISDPGVDLATLEGRSSMYLATAYTLAFIHATSRFNLVCLTELAVLANDPWGQRLVDDVLRQSRRAHAGLASDTQLARDYTRPELFIERTAARTSDEQGAAEAIRFCGAEPSVALVARLRMLETGLKLFHDRYGRVGFVDVLPPLDARTFMLYRTDPEALERPPAEVLSGA